MAKKITPATKAPAKPKPAAKAPAAPALAPPEATPPAAPPEATPAPPADAQATEAIAPAPPEDPPTAPPVEPPAPAPKAAKAPPRLPTSAEVAKAMRRAASQLCLDINESLEAAGEALSELQELQDAASATFPKGSEQAKAEGVAAGLPAELVPLFLKHDQYAPHGGLVGAWRHAMKTQGSVNLLEQK